MKKSEEGEPIASITKSECGQLMSSRTIKMMNENHLRSKLVSVDGSWLVLTMFTFIHTHSLTHSLTHTDTHTNFRDRHQGNFIGYTSKTVGQKGL